MSKIKIHELSFCEKEDSELHNIVGGLNALFAIYDSVNWAEEEPEYDSASEEVIYPQTTYTDSVQETVVKKDGSFGQARVVSGRTNGRKFVRSSSSARI